MSVSVCVSECESVCVCVCVRSLSRMPSVPGQGIPLCKHLAGEGGCVCVFVCLGWIYVGRWQTPAASSQSSRMPSVPGWAGRVYPLGFSTTLRTPPLDAELRALGDACVPRTTLQRHPKKHTTSAAGPLACSLLAVPYTVMYILIYQQQEHLPAAC